MSWVQIPSPALMGLHEQVEEIKKLPPSLRVAGYLARSARHAELGARLRLNGRPDESWTPEEDAEWDRLCDEIDPWWYAMTDEDKAEARKVDLYLASLCRGEYPMETYREKRVDGPGGIQGGTGC